MWAASRGSVPSFTACQPNHAMRLATVLNNTGRYIVQRQGYTDPISCDGNTLTQLKPSQGRFSLAALHPGSPIDGRPIQAQDNHFWIGQGPKWYCASALMCPTPNVTVLADTESLSIIAPGGQKVYIQANGALAFWGGFVYSTNLTVTGLGGPAYAGGSAFGPNGITWKACPVREGVWQVFSNLPSVTFAQDCIDFYAHVVPFLSGADVASAYV
ncbi:hypothetical protein K470DRAFT_258952 [Piedraia hortae CBS 480.64]|uniref:Uncharacterized protein n=1 Tax=Piedraia hortae CBS 480.64 TaxID=1314780 RepID=A0A6A7BW06_9PEZI|nr:hypothetical protein K470DRAFT_258952 [Piedraia hortae CBS 480.64]